MARCKIVIGLTWTLLVGAYLSPSMLEHLPGLEEAIQQFRDPIVLVYLNLYLDEARILLIQSVLGLHAKYVLIDLVRHFRQCRRFRYLKTWTQFRQVTVL